MTFLRAIEHTAIELLLDLGHTAVFRVTWSSQPGILDIDVQPEPDRATLLEFTKRLWAQIEGARRGGLTSQTSYA